MGMDTFVVGFMEPDAKFKKMYAAWKACEEADVDPPAEVLKYFQGEDPDPSGIEVDLTKVCEEWDEQDGAGFELSVKKIPQGVTKIRFYNSW